MKPPRWLRSHIQKVGAAHANRISSPNKGEGAPEPKAEEPAKPDEDFGEFSCKRHQDAYKDMCRKARQARENGDAKGYDYWIDKAEDFDRRKGIGRP